MWVICSQELSALSVRTDSSARSDQTVQNIQSPNRRQGQGNGKGEGKPACVLGGLSKCLRGNGGKYRTEVEAADDRKLWGQTGGYKQRAQYGIFCAAWLQSTIILKKKKRSENVHEKYQTFTKDYNLRCWQRLKGLWPNININQSQNQFTHSRQSGVCAKTHGRKKYIHLVR